MPVFDILVADFIPPGPVRDEKITEPISLPGDVIVAKRRYDEEVIRSCSPRGFKDKWLGPTGSFYSLTCPVDESKQQSGLVRWDPDTRIRRAVSCSRFVRTSAFGFTHAARITVSDSDELTDLIACPGNRAFSADHSRHWLTRDEWLEVGRIMQGWDNGKASKIDRVWMAIGCIEKVFQEHYLNVRWPLLATAIETLIGQDWKAGKPTRGRGKQFTLGLQKISDIAGNSMTNDEVADAWDLRSHLSHGQPGPPPAPGATLMNASPLYIKMEANVLKFLRNAIEDDALSANLATEAALAPGFDFAE